MERAAPPAAGQLLLGEIDAWCRRNGVQESVFGQLACPRPFPGFVGLLRKRGTVREDMLGHVRGFMARWPDGCRASDLARAREGAAVAHAEEVDLRSRAAAPGLAVRAAQPAAAPSPRANPQHGPIERALLDIRSVWPSIVIRIAKDAAAEGVKPAALLRRALEAGLLCLAEDRREGMRS